MILPVLARVIWSGGRAPTPTPSRLEILKALGDNTRYAIYLELARSPRPLATAEIADTLDLHPNTVRPHLERMREVGLLDQRIDNHGGVGRPQHLYSLAADAPSLGLEPPAMPALARMLLRVAAEAGLDGDDADGRRPRAGRPATPSASSAEHARASRRSMTQLEYLGFDPEATGGSDGVDHRLHPLPVPGAGRGQPRPGLRPAPGHGRGLRRRLGDGQRRAPSGRWSTVCPVRPTWSKSSVR